METKTCTKCDITYIIDMFPVRDKLTGRRHSWCSQCLKTYKAARWKANKETMKLYKKEWYEKNKEEQKAKCRLRYHAGDKVHHAEIVWKNKLIREFGITQDQYDLMLNEQQGVCKICGQKDNRRLAVDHYHVSGRIRGLLCRHCNTAIGLFDDNPLLLRKAADYLDEEMKLRLDHPDASVAPL
jgi:hypothetical protein